MPHNAIMAKKQPPQEPTQPEGEKGRRDRHKPSKYIRVRKTLADQLERLAERRATDATEETNRAVRELLEREGLWPPKE